jgi:hypothetical protein
VIDAYKQDKFFEKISEFLGYFFESIPLLPTILILISLTAFMLMQKNLHLDFRNELLLIFVHILMISFYGYYSRRLTFPIIILMLLVIIKLFFTLKSGTQKRILQVGLSVLVPIVIGSWIFTLGPLV